MVLSYCSHHLRNEAQEKGVGYQVLVRSRVRDIQEHKKDKDKLMNFLTWHGVGGNDENRMFSYLFGKRLLKEPAYDTADILCISDGAACVKMYRK